MDFDAAGLHQNHALMNIHQQIGLRPRGQLDLVMENGVRFQKRLPLGLRITAWGRRLDRESAVEAGDRENDCDEEPFVTQLRK